MLETVMSRISSALETYGGINAYTAFDCAPINRKGIRPITVISVEKLECSAPIYDTASLYIPFTASAAVSVWAAPRTDMLSLCGMFDNKIIPSLSQIAGLSCSMGELSFRTDTNLNRVVMKLNFTARGIKKYAWGNSIG